MTTRDDTALERGGDQGRPALLVVDVQNDFCPGGALAVSEGDQVIPVLNRCIERFSAAGLPVYASRDWHPPVTKHFRAYGGAWPPHCVQNTPGAEFHPQLRLPDGVVILTKGDDPEEDAYSDFQSVTDEGIPFAEQLRRDGIGRLYIGGLATDYCVRASALDARQAGLTVTLLEDAIRGVDVEPGDSARAIEEMQAAGVELGTCDEVLR